MATEQSRLCESEETTPSRPEGACINWAECGNLGAAQPNANNQMCDECLDAAREAGRGHNL